VRVYHFSEVPFPDSYAAHTGSLRITFPNRHFDPVLGADLLHHRLDEWALCDELGLDIMINEHHSTATCLTSSCMLPLAIMARETKRSRLLVLGVPIGSRRDPVLVAEELSYIDVVSRGRLEMGLVKGNAPEVAPSNLNPVYLTQRFWEAHDLIIKAMTTHDGPFNWEGEHFQFRQVNIWPRPYQQPTPPIWITCFNAHSATSVAERGHRACAGVDAVVGKAIFDSYRSHAAKIGRPRPSPDQFGYLVLVGVGRTTAEGHRRLKEIQSFFKATAVNFEQFANPPGYLPPFISAQILRTPPNSQRPPRLTLTRSGAKVNLVNAEVDQLIDAGAGFAGTPDEVFEQIEDLYNYLGGFGHMMAMMHGGDMKHADAVDNMTLFSREVLPRLKELKTHVPVSTQDDLQTNHSAH